jgi:putative aldouronate transport system substrate-binding protein
MKPIKALKTVCFVFCIMLLCAAIAGCGQAGKKNAPDDGPVLTLWKHLHPSVAGTATNYGDTEVAKELSKRTGVKVEFIHPPQGQENEHFNLMLASGDLPDMIEREFAGYPGGANKMVLDGHFIYLNDVLEKYAPNLTKYYEEHPEIEKMVVDDEGNHFLFPHLKEDRYLTISAGVFLRKDWLDELGLSIPETISEWETVLTEFKNKKGCEAPLAITFKDLKMPVFAGAYKIHIGFYHDNNLVKYGPYSQNFKDFLTEMKRWYDNGLIDRNFPTANTTTVETSIYSEKSGAAYSSLGGGLGGHLKVGAPYAVLSKGDAPEYEFMTNIFYHFGTGITTSCENVDLAAKYLDYVFSPEGHMLVNFGIEGLSYTMVDGYPKFTELITNNPDGLSIQYAMAKYSRAGCAGTMVQDKRYYEQYLKYPQQRETLERWLHPKAGTHIMPPILHTSEESTELAKITNDLTTYVDEMMLKFITGQEPLSKFDEYMERLRALGVERAISIKQAALDRYNNR